MLNRSSARLFPLAMLAAMLVACGKEEAASHGPAGAAAPIPVTTQVVQPKA